MGLEFELRAKILPLEPHLQSISLGYFGDGGLVNYLPRGTEILLISDSQFI
jgi:hypothetical protein